MNPLSAENPYRCSSDVERLFATSLRPDPPLTVSEWADRYRILSTRLAAEPGPYRTSRAPFLKDVMDALSPLHPARRVVFMKSAQVGATEAGNNWLGYIIHWSPAPVLSVWPTVDMAKRGSRQRIEPLIEDTPELSALVAPSNERDGGNTMTVKIFPGGVLVLTGANSAVGLRSMPARFTFLDEIDAYPGDVDGEGDPVGLVRARMTTFGKSGKMFLVSTPTVHGMSRIEREFNASDQRRYHIPCPHCEGYQWLKFERLKWDKGDPASVHYVCEHCDGKIEERHKAEFLPAGVWQATATSRDPETVGFHISGLYSPLGWLSWSDIARQWEEAEDDNSSKKRFVNTVLGEPFFEDAEAVDWERIFERRETWRPGTVPNGVTILNAAVDVQASPARLELHVWGWGPGLESWAIDRKVIDGRADDPATWAKLAEACEETYSHPSGVEIKIEKIAIDTGDQTTSVYSWISQQDQARFIAIKGKQGYEINAPVSSPTNIPFGNRKKAIRLRSVTGDVFKTEFYQFLGLFRKEGEIPPGYVHVPDYLDAEFCKQLVSEHRIRTKTGKFRWEKIAHPRNEALDCRVYARAALWTMGVAAWKPEKWAYERRRRGIADVEIVAAEQEEARQHEAEALPVPPTVTKTENPKLHYRRNEWFGAERGNLRGEDW